MFRSSQLWISTAFLCKQANYCQVEGKPVSHRARTWNLCRSRRVWLQQIYSPHPESSIVFIVVPTYTIPHEHEDRGSLQRSQKLSTSKQHESQIAQATSWDVPSHSRSWFKTRTQCRPPAARQLEHLTCYILFCCSSLVSYPCVFLSSFQGLLKFVQFNLLAYIIVLCMFPCYTWQYQ